MKNIVWIVSLLLFISCNGETDQLELLDSNEQNSKNLESKIVLKLTSDETEDLIFLREEEKLARDVYIFSYNKYGSKVFGNIIESEVQHMSSVLKLLVKYNIEDPASNIIGVFNNLELQEIYNSLIDLSNTSLLNAFIAGDKIEDLDILDLTINESRTTKSDLLSVYGSLKCGSKNHLRSFYSQTLLYNGTYIPEYITQQEFDAIINSPSEKCGNY